ncbi:general secretion pathway protein GspB [Thiocystis violascens]|uniref:Type II secretion system protein GspB C-terminal domain-containing protein n=1 Tax=Thiocystis violascens (strain ATCC 17096 / DSM 198 / 6111) TaxID=765911 RepID=I3YBL2_THIV6|nr:general secretion pathway protein GspB [Thiocystis violascens]AFL74380.1 hypothetical protein Thivi_2439 [Thiocystis violascens DSM 198]
MSYILEALKKSQQERELGQVPTLETAGIFREDKEPIPTNHWGLLAVGLAALAVVIALFAALREPTKPPTALEAPESQRDVAVATPEDPFARDRQTASESPDPLPFAPAAPLAEAPPPKRPAHAIQSSPGTRAADPAEPVSLDEIMDYPNPNLDPALERELQRQLDAEQFQFDDTEPLVMEPPQRAPIPVDLIDDIESFKQQVRREQGLPPPKSSAGFKPVRIDGDPTRLRLTPQQQAQTPGYLMTVHVYDPDAAKRFVLINALKYREGEETREGLRVERILADGAVLSYQGNPFYVAR